MTVYDFGAGYRRSAGVISVDVREDVDPDIVADVTKPITEIAPGSADEIHCNHVLEHIPHPGHFDAMREICRCLRVGGRWIVKVPHPGHDSAMVPGHVQVLAPHYWRDIQRNPRGYLSCALEVDTIEEVAAPDATDIARRLGLSLPECLRLIRNAATETVVTGHKVSE